MPKFTLGCIVGFSVGYYLGARAGYERYEYLRSVIARIQLSQLPAAIRPGRQKINPAASVVIPPSAN